MERTRGGREAQVEGKSGGKGGGVCYTPGKLLVTEVDDDLIITAVVVISVTPLT